MRRAAIALVVASLLAGCGGDSASTGAEPSSTAAADVQTQTVAEPAKPQRTTEFLGGEMTVTLENGWVVTEDSGGHFAAAEADEPDYRVMFSLDPYPFRDGRKVNGVAATAADLSKWVRASPDLRVAAEWEASIGGKIPATVADLSISGTAENDDPGCPADTCVLFFAFPPSGDPYGIAGDDVVRLYLADFEYDGTKHVLAVTVEGSDRADLDAFLAPAERMIAGAQLPTTPS